MHLTLPGAAPGGEIDRNAAVLQELERILDSEEFARAERMRRFLRYAVECTLADKLGELKESVIGVEVFDLAPSYDPKSNPIVRIEARRLRDKLKHYYHHTGENDRVRIDLPKGGYAASIEILGSAETNPEPTPVPTKVEGADAVPGNSKEPSRTGFRWRPLVVIAAATCLLIAAFVFWRRAVRERSATPLAVRTFTSLPGAETDPSFSPDGLQVVFVWTGPKSDKSNLYIQRIDRFTPVLLTNETEGDVSSPVWSPQGKEIAFLRSTGRNRFGIFSIELSTRLVRHRGEIESEPAPVGPRIHLDWSPDGRYFLTTHRKSLVLISTKTGAMTQLTTVPERAAGHFDAVFSPDGWRVAFRQVLSYGADDLYVVPIEGGPVARLTYQNQSIRGHTWSADGKSIIFALQRSLWRVPADGGEPRRITDGTVNALAPVASRAGRRLAFASPKTSIRIWRIPVKGAGQPEPILASTLTDVSPNISPDGKRITFRSDRSGSDEIWVANSDGSNPAQLTRFSGPVTGCPRWSPDGKQIAFDSRPQGKSDIYLIGANSGRLRHFTNHPDDEVVPSWSRDGQYIYFASNRTGDWQVWKQPIIGGAAVRVTRRGGFSAWESPDGQYVYYAKDRSGYGLWRVPVKGGEEQPVVPGLEPGMWGNWHIGSHGLVYAEAGPPFRLRMVDLPSMGETEIGRLHREPLTGDAGLTLSPDGRWVYVALADPLASDIFLVDEFQ